LRCFCRNYGVLTRSGYFFHLSVGFSCVDSFTGGSGDWARSAAGIRYSFELELRDRGHFGFMLPANYVRPVGDETWSAVQVLTSKILAENRNHRELTTPSAKSYWFSRVRTPGPFVPDTTTIRGSGTRIVFSLCAVILTNFAIEQFLKQRLMA